MIGEPHYVRLITGAPICGPATEPVALPTKLGYVLTGSYARKKNENQNDEDETLVSMRCEEVPIQLEQFWDLEHIGIKPVQNEDFTPEEEEAVVKMKKSLRYDKEKKQWSTTLLWKDDKSFIDNNRNRSIAVMKQVERKAIANKQTEIVNEAYKSFPDGGYSEEVPSDEIFPVDNRKVYYLQTHPVFRPDHETTKCRIVMNAGAKDKNGTSLNDLLLQGPCLLPDLVKVLLRFRYQKFVLILDIAKMFLRIKMRKDKDCLRYVWRDCDQESVIKILRMMSITFGVISSPFQSIFTVREHANLFEEKFPEAKKAIEQDMYVDDLGTGKSTLKKATELADELLQLFELASMTPHKWAASHEEILKNIPQELFAPPGARKFLGVLWNPQDDDLVFDVFAGVDSESKEKTETKRSVLNQRGTIFDPMGIVTPFTLRAKLIFQDLWMRETKWDEELPPDLQEKWSEWKQEIKEFTDLKKKRCITNCSNATMTKSEVFGFGDASEMAYGTAIYVRTQYDDGTIDTNLVLAKSRVAPLAMIRGLKKKELTIVRLELLAALCTARAAAYVADALQIEVGACMTDSQINLYRIKNGGLLYKQWVGNRLNEIVKLVPQEKWQFCPGLMNPADLSSRGCTAKMLETSTLWWKGPEFLHTAVISWPTVDKKKKIEDLELKKTQETTVNINQEFSDEFLKIFNRFESWTKTVRFFSYILRAGCKGHQQFQKKKITVEESRKTEEYLWRISQERGFSQELTDLKKKNLVNKNSKIRDYNPKFDEERRLILSETRLVQSNLPEETKRPIVLPKNCPIVNKYVMFIHASNCHIGPEQTLSLIKRKIRICQARRQIKAILRRCVTPRCVQPSLLEQQMAPLPALRTDSPAAFSVVAVDLFGPMYARHWCQFDNCPHPIENKVYCALFTCFHSRAVHLELIRDQGTEEFLNSFRSFVGRRGVPEHVHSDNAKNFKKGCKEIKALYKSIDWEKVDNEGQKKQINMSFSTAEAPWCNAGSCRMNGLKC